MPEETRDLVAAGKDLEEEGDLRNHREMTDLITNLMHPPHRLKKLWERGCDLNQQNESLELSCEDGIERGHGLAKELAGAIRIGESR